MSRSGSVYFRTRNMSRFGRTLLTSLITVVSVAVAVSLFVVWRAVDDPPRSPAGIKRLSDGIFVADDEIGFRVRPNLSVVREINGRRTAVNTGPMGERTDGSTVEDVSSVGILTFGGSQSFGSGVVYRDTFSAQLAERLGISEKNFSQPSQGTVASLLLMRRHANLLPKLYLYGLWVDHIERNVKRCVEMNSPLCLERPIVVANRNGRFVLRPPGQTQRKMDLVADWFLTYSADRDDHSIFRDIYWAGVALSTEIEKFFRDQSIAPQFKERATIHLLKEMANLAAANEGKLIVIYITGYDQPRPSVPAPRAISAAVKSAGGLFVDMTADFNRLRDQGEKIGIPGDGHLAPRSHEAIANAVIARLDSVGRK